MDKKEVRDFKVIDILKLFFCLCIVALHSRALINWKYVYYIQNGVFRLAVPFFFCTSGFFIGKKIQSGKSAQSVIHNFIVRVFPAYLLFLIINTLFYIRDLVVIKHLGGKEIVINVFKSLIFYPQGALWYVWASIIALLILKPFIESNKVRLAVFLGVGLYSFALIGNTYYFLIENTILQKVIDFYLNYFISTRNGLFVGLLFMSLGIECSKFNVNKFHNLLVDFILLYILFVMEIFFLRDKTYVDDKALYIMLIPLIPTLLLGASKINLKLNIPSKKMRDLSVGVYFLHRAVLYCLNAVNVHYNLNIGYFETYVIVTVIAILISLISYKIPNKRLNCFLK